MVVTTNTANLDQQRAWSIASKVLDPEVPCVTIADLGILREVSFEDGFAVVKLTPTYSGCPAVLAIEMSVETALLEAGIEARIERIISPAWSTDWITDEGREKLRAYGIAPPVKGKATGKLSLFSDETIACPRCESTDTNKISEFGSTACKAQYQCKSCFEPFDYFKCI